VILHTDHCQRSWLPWFDGLMDANEEYFKKEGAASAPSHLLCISCEPRASRLATPRALRRP
jgi:fructose-bisphosphate aldolase class II